MCVCTIYSQREDCASSNTTHEDLMLQLPRKKNVEKNEITLQRVCSSEAQRRGRRVTQLLMPHYGALRSAMAKQG